MGTGQWVARTGLGTIDVAGRLIRLSHETVSSTGLIGRFRRNFPLAGPLACETRAFAPIQHADHIA